MPDAFNQEQYFNVIHAAGDAWVGFVGFDANLYRRSGQENFYGDSENYTYALVAVVKCYMKREASPLLNQFAMYMENNLPITAYFKSDEEVNKGDRVQFVEDPQEQMYEITQRVSAENVPSQIARWNYYMVPVREKRPTNAES
jgi:hypothetical protein